MSKTYDYHEGSFRNNTEPEYYYCKFCGREVPMRDKEDFGTLCEECYRKEYND